MMRNLKQYPITEDEVIGAVANSLERYRATAGIGGNDGFILHHLQDLLKNDKEVMDKLLIALKI